MQNINSDGTVSWAKSAGGVNYDEGIDIASDATGNIYQLGDFGSSTITFGSYTLSRVGSQDIFITKYDSAGTVLYAEREGGSSGEIPAAVSINNNGVMNITGNFSSPYLPFGPDTLTCMGGYNIFIARMDSMLYTAAKENIDKDDIIIFPNPFNDQTILKTSVFLNDASITLYNVFGQSVAEINNLNGHSAVIYRNKLPNGLYFARLVQGDKMIATKKIIISD